MLFLIDSANLEQIKKCIMYFPVDGVTTNPSILANINNFKSISQIRDLIGPDKMLHVQVTAKTSEGMIEEANQLKKAIGNNLYIKIPVTLEGIKAIMALTDYGINVTATAVFTPQQALIAARAGASFVAPYVNRLDAICGDGVSVVADIVQVLNNTKLPCKVLAASLKTSEQVNKLALSGCQSITIIPDLFYQLISHPLTDEAVRGFDRDWQNRFTNKSIVDFI